MPSKPSGIGVAHGMVPLPWAAPEIWDPATAATATTPKADVWSGGIAFYQVLNGGKHPLEIPGHALDEDGGRPVARRALEQQPGWINTAVPPGANTPPMSQPMADMLNRMLHPDPNQRASFSELTNDPVFNRPDVGSPETRELLAGLATPAANAPREFVAGSSYAHNLYSPYNQAAQNAQPAQNVQGQQNPQAPQPGYYEALNPNLAPPVFYSNLNAPQPDQAQNASQPNQPQNAPQPGYYEALNPRVNVPQEDRDYEPAPPRFYEPLQK